MSNFGAYTFFRSSKSVSGALCFDAIFSVLSFSAATILAIVDYFASKNRVKVMINPSDHVKLSEISTFPKELIVVFLLTIFQTASLFSVSTGAMFDHFALILVFFC